jgi:plasmid stabilization system protein ParE
MRFQFASRAKQDLREIRAYIARDSRDSADRTVRRVREAVRSLSQTPWLGHAREDVRYPHARFYLVYSYLIVYETSDTRLVVLRVLHGARDLPSVLAGQD